MRFAALIIPAFVALASAQTPNLQSALSGNSDLSSLASLLSSNRALLSSLEGASNITVLAPSNTALSPYLNSSSGGAGASVPGAIQALLQYHVLNGTYPVSSITNTSSFISTLLTNSSFTNVTHGQRVQALRAGNTPTFYSALLAKSTVTQSVNFTGGVIHILDGVLRIPYSASRTLTDAGLSSLAGALNQTKLLSAVDSLKDATIFAPSNAAFERIGSAFADANSSTISSVLSYHVISGSSDPYYSTRLTNNTSLKTLGGTDLTIYSVNGSWFVNQAKIIISDVLISGGVVHVIDNVLNPQDRGSVPADSSAGSIAYSGASSATAALFTSGVPSATATIGTTPTNAGADSTSTSKTGAAVMAFATGVIGTAALFGAGALLVNL